MASPRLHITSITGPHDVDEPEERDPVEDLIENLEGGEIGDVEFTELAMAAGLSMERIGAELAKAREEF